MVQTLQPTQSASETILALVSASTEMASTGQARMHQASSHWGQV